jgi:hypothetical protein
VWNSTVQKTGILAAGALLFLLGLPTFVFGKAVYDTSCHAAEVEKELSWLVEEIESLFDQTNSIMIANLHR